ncbi:MAG: hypothetical protein NXH91_04860 [Phyllobacteriaceae bacterium]|nr:hypothetical protein [Phyllobacteriaceae bacterium]
MCRVRVLLCSLACSAAALSWQAGPARAQALVDVCSGLSVDLPVLDPVSNAASGLLGGLLDPVLNLIIGEVNNDIQVPLSGQNIGLSILDTDGNAVALGSGCELRTQGVDVDNGQGITMGGGSIDGLGGTGNPTASAGEADAIAIGNGASTAAGSTGAVALGLRGSVTAVDGVAIGRDSTASAAGGIALGAGTVANRAGMAGANETFSGTSVASTAGALSVGAAGAERQITNVAGGTADTDAVNLRQLRAVGDNLAGAIGGGAAFDPTTGLFTDPSFTIRGTTHNDVGSALAALDTALNSVGGDFGVIAANNTSGLADAAASGSDALAVGWGARASGTDATATGAAAQASGDRSVAQGARAVASGSGATAVGHGASATHAGSTALGAGARTDRANQIVLGTAANTYTMPGIASDASRATQSGPTQIVTTDAGGNLAAVPLQSLLGDLASAVGSDIDHLNRRIDQVQTESRRGIAAVMAMANAPMPSAPGRTTWAANMGVYKSEWASGFAVAHRLDTPKPSGITAAFSLNADGLPAARAGLFGEF